MSDLEVLNWIAVNAARVLEVGESTGLRDAYLRRNPNAQYELVDLETWSTRPGQTGEGFDVVVLAHLLAAADDPSTILARAYEALRPGGVLVCSVLNAGHWTCLAALMQGRWPPTSPPFDGPQQRPFTNASLHKALLLAGFKPLKARGRKDVVDRTEAERWAVPLADAAQSLGLDRTAFLSRVATLSYTAVAEKPRAEAAPSRVASVVFAAMAPRFLEARAEVPAQLLNSLPDVSVDFQRHSVAVEQTPPEPRILILQRLKIVDHAGYAQSIRRFVSKGWIVIADLDDHPALLSTVSGEDIEAKWLPLTMAHGVQTSTPALAEAFRAYNPEVAVFPNAVGELPGFEASAGEPLRVFYGALNREGFSRRVAGALRPCIEAHPEVEFLVVNDRAFFDALPTDRKVFRPALPYNDYLDAMATCHILLTPLEGTFGELFKSDIKYLEASARGLATVASAAVYADTIVEEETGLIARSLEDWPAALGRLLGEEALRTRLARNAWEYVRSERMFAHQAQARRDWMLSLWERREPLSAALFQRHPELKIRSRTGR